MIINTDFIGNEIRTFKFNKEPRYFSEIAGMIEEGRFDVLSDVSAEITAHKIQEIIEVKGQVAMKIRIYCSRCLEWYTSDITDSFELSFYRADTEKLELNEEIELNSADLDKEYYHGNEIDIAKHVQDQLIIALPITPLCSEGCKGLCTDCGANLNTGKCSCRKETGHPAFSVLKNLKV